MRSTKASAAVERLNKRSGGGVYVLSCRADGLFALFLRAEDGAMAPIGVPLSLDEFVRFVNGLQPEKAKPVGKLDAAFRKQLRKN